jgi:hypothetical protein
MVYVTEIHAVIQGISVDYTMSGIERQICELISVQLSRYLNDWFYGLVSFEVDTYFTTVAVGNESFTQEFNSDYTSTYFIMANDIPEISGMIENYESIITTFCMNDYSRQLHRESGSAHIKYAAINMEEIFSGLPINSISIESILDLEDPNLQYITSVYIHELTHTIELSVYVYDFHEALGYGNKNGISHLEIERQYLLNQLLIDGQQVGIPYSFWVGELEHRGVE